MIKKTSSKIALVLGLVGFATASFAASEAHYGLPSQVAIAAKSSANAKQAGPVVLHNYTYATYMAYATFVPSNKSYSLPVGRYGSGTDVITYNIDYPDYKVCVKVVRDSDLRPVFNDCLPAGYDINIGGRTKTAGEPTVNVTRRI